MKNKKVKPETKIVKQDGVKESVHYSIKNRKRFKARMLLLFFLFLIIMAGACVMIKFGGYYWNPGEEGFSPTEKITKPYQYALIWGGVAIALLDIVGLILICVKQFRGFYATQEKYFKSKEFEQRKRKVLSNELNKYKKSTLKWYKKMGYINGAQYKEALAVKKLEEKEAKAKAKAQKQAPKVEEKK